MYRQTFTHLLHQLYEELEKRDIRDKTLLILGAQILIHVFRLSCIRGHEMKTVIYHCKEVHVYFFEYMQQMEESGLTLEHGKMASFIYDKVLKPGPPAFQEDEIGVDELDRLTDILSVLPDVSSRVTMHTLKELWKTPSEIVSCNATV